MVNCLYLHFDSVNLELQIVSDLKISRMIYCVLGVFLHTYFLSYIFLVIWILKYWSCKFSDILKVGYDD